MIQNLSDVFLKEEILEYLYRFINWCCLEISGRLQQTIDYWRLSKFNLELPQPFYLIYLQSCLRNWFPMNIPF